MFAIESILSDYIDERNGDRDEKTAKDCVSLENDFFSTSHLDLVQEYFQFEIALWSSVVECEFLISHRVATTQEPSFDEHTNSILTAWRLVWRNIVSYIKCSTYDNVLQSLWPKHSHFYKNVNLKRNKHVITLDSGKQDALRRVIGKLLDAFCLEKAKEVASLFSYTHDDFEIIQVLFRFSNCEFVIEFFCLFLGL